MARQVYTKSDNAWESIALGAVAVIFKEIGLGDVGTVVK